MSIVNEYMILRVRLRARVECVEKVDKNFTPQNGSWNTKIGKGTVLSTHLAPLSPGSLEKYTCARRNAS